MTISHLKNEIHTVRKDNTQLAADRDAERKEKLDAVIEKQNTQSELKLLKESLGKKLKENEEKIAAGKKSLEEMGEMLKEEKKKTRLLISQMNDLKARQVSLKCKELFT